MIKWFRKIFSPRWSEIATCSFFRLVVGIFFDAVTAGLKLWFQYLIICLIWVKGSLSCKLKSRLISKLELYIINTVFKSCFSFSFNNTHSEKKEKVLSMHAVDSFSFNYSFLLILTDLFYKSLLINNLFCKRKNNENLFWYFSHFVIYQLKSSYDKGG